MNDSNDPPIPADPEPDPDPALQAAGIPGTAVSNGAPEKTKPKTFKQEWAEASSFARIGIVGVIMGIFIGLGAWLIPAPFSETEVERTIIPEAFAAENNINPQQLQQIIDAVNNLKIEGPREGVSAPAIEHAIEALSNGNLNEAEALFQTIYDNKARDAATARKDQAEAARNLAALSVVDDKAAALALYREATTLDPSNAAAWLGLTDVAIVAGTLSEAARATTRYLKLQDDQSSRAYSIGLTRLGDIRTAQGNLTGALEAYQAGLDIADTLAKADPHNTQWQRDLFVSHIKIGDIRTAQGNLTSALEAYQAGLDIRDSLAKADPNNTEWQRDLSVSHDKIGNIRTAQGNLSAALEAYQAGLDIADALAKADPNNTQWQRDLSVSHNKIGDIRTAQGNLSAALEAYQAALNIADALAKADPNNTQWQRDLSVSHNKIGNIWTAQGNLSGALDAYQTGLDIADTLAKADPHNTQWQRDLSISHNKIGDIQNAQGDLSAALEAYQAGHDIADALAKADPHNTEWQRDLSISHNKIGDIRKAQGNLTGALEAYQADLDIADALAKADPNNTQWQRDLIVSHVKLAEAGGDAVSHYRQALEVAERLQAEGKLAPVDDWMVGDLRERLKAAEGE